MMNPRAEMKSNKPVEFDDGLEVSITLYDWCTKNVNAAFLMKKIQLHFLKIS